MSDGIAFIFWNEWAIDPQTHDIAAIRQAYDQVAPGLVPDLADDWAAESWAEKEILSEPRLMPTEHKVFGWEASLRARHYLDLLATISQYAVSPQAVRTSLFESLLPLLGTEVSLKGRTVLLTSRRSS